MDRTEAIGVLTIEQASHRKDGLVDRAIDMAIAALRDQEQSKWISVKERLPECEIDVLARCYYNANWCLQVCHLGRWIKGNWFTSVAGQRVEVSHWMPLPELPEGGAEG